MPKAPNESSFHETKCWNTFKRQFYAIWCCEMRDTSTKQFGDLWIVKLGFWQNRANAEAWFWLSKAIIKDTKCIKKMSNTLELLSCEDIKYIGASKLWGCQIHWSFWAVRMSNTLELLCYDNVKYIGASELWECQIYWSFRSVRTWQPRVFSVALVASGNPKITSDFEQKYIWVELYIQKFWRVAKYCRSFWATIIFQQQTKWWILVGCSYTWVKAYNELWQVCKYIGSGGSHCIGSHSNLNSKVTSENAVQGPIQTTATNCFQSNLDDLSYKYQKPAQNTFHQNRLFRKVCWLSKCTLLITSSYDNNSQMRNGILHQICNGFIWRSLLINWDQFVHPWMNSSL